WEWAAWPVTTARSPSRAPRSASRDLRTDLVDAHRPVRHHPRPPLGRLLVPARLRLRGELTMTTNPTTWRGVYRGVPATCRVLTDLDGVEGWARSLGATCVEVSANGVDIDETWFQRGDTVVHIEGAGFLPYDTETA